MNTGAQVGLVSSRHVLVVAHAFPPASPIGTMRTLRIVRRLSADGWCATVLTSSPHTYRADTPFDPELLTRVPEDVHVIHASTLRIVERLRRFLPQRRHVVPRSPAVAASAVAAAAPARRPSLLRRVASFADEVTAIPDKDIGWVLPALWASLRAVRSRRPDIIYSSAPPWSGQLVALCAAKLTGLPWVADFRDPWARAPWRETRPGYARRTAAWLERIVVRRADAVLFATKANRDDYAAHYGPSAAAKFHFVPNGCDPEEFASVKRVPRTDGIFVLTHTGSLYGARSPLPLFNAIARGIQHGTLDARRFRVRLVGAIGRLTGTDDLRNAVAGLGLGGVVEFVPRVPRREALAEMASASCLLTLQPGTSVSVPGKVYEYLAIGLPILALADEGETADLVRESGLGLVCPPHDESVIERALAALTRAAGTPVVAVPTALYDGNEAAGEAIHILANVLASRDAAARRHPSRPAATAVDRGHVVKTGMKSNAK